MSIYMFWVIKLLRAFLHFFFPCKGKVQTPCTMPSNLPLCGAFLRTGCFQNATPGLTYYPWNNKPLCQGWYAKNLYLINRFNKVDWSSSIACFISPKTAHLNFSCYWHQKKCSCICQAFRWRWGHRERYKRGEYRYTLWWTGESSLGSISWLYFSRSLYCDGVLF